MKISYKVLKYATGAEVPEGAKYLWSCKNGDMQCALANDRPANYQYVWHYFLITVTGETT